MNTNRSDYNIAPQPDEEGQLYVLRDLKLTNREGEFRQADEALISDWLAGGMVGRLVRRGLVPLAVEACAPEHDGEWAIREYA